MGGRRRAEEALLLACWKMYLNFKKKKKAPLARAGDNIR